MKWLRTRSLQTQLVLTTGLAIVVIAAAAGLVVGLTWLRAGQGGDGLEAVTLRFLTTLIVAALVSLVFVALVIRQLLRPLHQLGQHIHDASTGTATSDIPVKVATSWELSGLQASFGSLIERVHTVEREHLTSQIALADRRRTVEHLLDFSQTIQGAGRQEQIFAALAYSLRVELGLAGLVILAHDAQAMPMTQVKVSYPDAALNAACPAVDLDAAACPCLRQGLPKCFKPNGSPIRCSIDASLNLSPDHAAYCIPFTIGRRTQILAHLMLPIAQAWTEELRQLAQTYVNAAHSCLLSLHMLSEAEMQSMTDPLTQLYNRRSMEQLLEREVALSERHSHPLSLVMIDMDGFKQINDSHGHAAGDHMLKQFADCVRITLRKTDLAFRFGGDEFVIALPQTGIAQAQAVVGKLRQGFAAVDFSDAIAHLEHQPTLSIGVAERSKGTGILTLQNLLAAADAALYDAKAAQRNCIRVYQPPKAA